MPYEFAENEFELEPAAASGRSGKPPRKYTTAGVLDSHLVPKRPPEPVPAAHASLFLRILGGVMIAGLVAGILFLLIAKR